MPDLEDLRDPDMVLYKNGKPYRSIDVLYGFDEGEPPKRIKKYSTKRIRRMHENAMQRAMSEPTSFAEARERGLNYWWDSES